MALTSEKKYVYHSHEQVTINVIFNRIYFSERQRYFFFKRIIDFSIACLAIVFLLSWITPLLALLIKLDSKGPVFFRQRRTGFLGKIFTCYKFRTMEVNSEADCLQATEDDARLTRVGKWLRKPGIDELPQLINVLFGQMSIIGPRPHMLLDNHRFAKLIPRYRSRSLVPPGITGLSQVMGCRGATSTYDAVYRRFQWDDYYAKNVSVSLDLKILARTAMLMLRSFKTDKAIHPAYKAGVPAVQP